MSSIVIFIAAGVAGLLFDILFALAIHRDCKAKNIKAKTAYTVLAFFFPFIVGIVYACTRNTAQRNSSELPANSAKLAKQSVILFVVSVILFVATIGISAYFTISAATGIMGNVSAAEYYDIKGNKFEDSYVDIYDKDGNAYQYYLNEETYEAFYVNKETGEKFDDYMCYVDEEGCFFYDENEELSDTDDLISQVDADGNKYYYANSVYWDEDGNLKHTISILDDIQF